MAEAVIHIHPYDPNSNEHTRCIFCKVEEGSVDKIRVPGEPKEVERKTRMIKGPGKGINICEACVQVCHELFHPEFYAKLDATSRDKSS